MVGDNYRHTVSANKTLITGTPGKTTTRITLAALCTVSCVNRVHTDFQNFRNLATTRHISASGFSVISCIFYVLVSFRIIIFIGL